jgi:peptidoglycan/xylan/chitin deacetylase (PgdA/CDA1 family)
LDDDQRLFGRKPTLFRPPFGSMDNNTVAATANCGLSAVVLWNATVNRGQLQRATPGPLTSGDIILLHWGPGLAADLVVLSAYLDRSGLRTALLEDYLGPRPATVLESSEPPMGRPDPLLPCPVPWCRPNSTKAD